jgi:hypothetical protein
VFGKEACQLVMVNMEGINGDNDTVHSLINLNATVTSWLVAGTATKAS